MIKTTMPPPSYESVCNDQSAINEIITTEPPRYEDIVDIEDSFLKTLSITGIKKDSFSNFGPDITDRNISNLTVSQNNVAFKQNICCNPFTKLYCQNLVIVVDRHHPENNRIILNEKFNTNINSISSTQNGKKIMVLSNNDTTRSFYIISNTNIEDRNQSINQNTTNNVAYTYKNQGEIYAAKYDQDENLYIADIINKQLVLLKIEIDTNGFPTSKWNKLVDFPANFITNISFSNDGAYLFILSEDNTLQVVSKHTNWQQVNRVKNITNLPIDIDSSGDFLVFNNGKELQIKGITSDIECSLILENYISTACFIPETNNLIVFDIYGKVIEVKYAYNNWTLDKKNSKNLVLTSVEEAYFDPNDKTKLIVLTKDQGLEFDNIIKILNSFLLHLSTTITFTTVGAGIGCFTSFFKNCLDGGYLSQVCYKELSNVCLDHCFFPEASACLPTCATCTHDTAVGATIGTPFGAFCSFVDCLASLVKMNTIPTKLEECNLTPTEPEEPENNEISRF